MSNEFHVRLPGCVCRNCSGPGSMTPTFSWPSTTWTHTWAEENSHSTYVGKHRH
jgi:hypothetical protein